MAWQQSDLDTLETNIASGIFLTRFADGREVRYQSLDMMIAARQVIADTLAAADAKAKGMVRRKYGAYRSGL